MVKGQMGNKRGNPAWYRGMLSANPKGRPRGQTSFAVFCQDPHVFLTRHIRWWRFSHEHIMAAANGAEAARRAGYSPKSARFIASRLIRNSVIRAKLRELGKIINATRKISEGVWLIPDYSGEYHIYRKKKI